MAMRFPRSPTTKAKADPPGSFRGGARSARLRQSLLQALLPLPPNPAQIERLRTWAAGEGLCMELTRERGRPPMFWGYTQNTFTKFVACLSPGFPALTQACHVGFANRGLNSLCVVLHQAWDPNLYWIAVQTRTMSVGNQHHMSCYPTPGRREDVLEVLQRWALNDMRWTWNAGQPLMFCRWTAHFPHGRPYWYAAWDPEQGVRVGRSRVPHSRSVVAYSRVVRASTPTPRGNRLMAIARMKPSDQSDNFSGWRPWDKVLQRMMSKRARAHFRWRFLKKGYDLVQILTGVEHAKDEFVVERLTPPVDPELVPPRLPSPLPENGQ